MITFRRVQQTIEKLYRRLFWFRCMVLVNRSFLDNRRSQQMWAFTSLDYSSSCLVLQSMPDSYIQTLPSSAIRSPSGYTCAANHRIAFSLNVHNIYALHQPSASSINDPNAPNSLCSNNVCTPASHSLDRSFLACLGLLLFFPSLSVSHHRRQSQVHCLCAVALARTSMQCRTIRPSRVQSSSQCRWHLSLVDRSCDGSADRVEHSHGESSYSTVHQSVHDEWWSTAEQHPADICELSREREGGRVRWCVFRMYASIFDRVRVAMEDMWHRADRSADNHPHQ